MSRKLPLSVLRACGAVTNKLAFLIARSIQSPPGLLRPQANPLEPRLLLTTVALTPGVNDTVHIDSDGTTVSINVSNASGSTSQSVSAASFTDLTLTGEQGGTGSDAVYVSGSDLNFTFHSDAAASDSDKLTLWASSGSAKISDAEQLDLLYVDQNASFSTLAGADLNVRQVAVVGDYFQSGGSVTATEFDTDGGNAQHGHVDITGGSLSASTAQWGGGNGWTNITQSGGSLSFGTFQMGLYSGSTSTMEQTGGSFNATDFWLGYYGHASWHMTAGASLTSAGEHIGNWGYATFTNDGGTNSGGMELGPWGGHALYTQTAGSTTGGAGVAWWNGNGTINLSGGTWSGGTWLGGWGDNNWGSGNLATFNQTGGASDFTNGGLILGYTGGHGVFYLAGGTMTAPGICFGFAQGGVDEGVAEFHQTGGHENLTAASIYDANPYGGQYPTHPLAIYHLSTGALHTTRADAIDASAVDFTGGTWTSGTLDGLAILDEVVTESTTFDLATDFTDSDANPSYLSATIEWDGAAAAGPVTILSTTSGGHIHLTHEYPLKGLYHALLKVIEANGSIAEAAFDVNVISQVSAIHYYDETQQQISVSFASYGNDVNANWLLLHSLTTDADYPVANQVWQQSFSSRIGTFTFKSPLPDGDYIATIGDADHRAAASAQGIGEEQFFVWSGDVNHDRQVTGADLQIAQSNLGLQNAQFSQGDVDYNGVVNQDDINLITSRLGAVLAQPAMLGTISVTALGTNSIAASWTRVIGAAGYRIQISDDGEDFAHYKDLVDDDTTAVTASGLESGSRYWFRVRAYGNGKDTSYTPKQDATTIAIRLTSATGCDFTALAGETITPTLMQVSYSYANSSTPDLSPLIDWGDGTSSDGVVQKIDDLDYAIVGTHQYTAPDHLDVIVTINGQYSSYSAVSHGTINDAGPQIATEPTASSYGTTVNLSVLGSDLEGEDELTYTWSAIDNPPSSVTFDENATHNARNTYAVISKAGTYKFHVKITNSYGQSVEQNKSIDVTPYFSGFDVTPANTTVQSDQPCQMTAVAYDQFGDRLDQQPTVYWLASIGSIDEHGLYTPPNYSYVPTYKATIGAFNYLPPYYYLPYAQGATEIEINQSTSTLRQTGFLYTYSLDPIIKSGHRAISIKYNAALPNGQQLTDYPQLYRSYYDTDNNAYVKSLLTSVPITGSEYETLLANDVTTDKDYYYYFAYPSNAAYGGSPNGFAASASDVIAEDDVEDNRIKLRWKDNSQIEDGFEVQWSSDGTNFQTIATMGKHYPNDPDPSYVDLTPSLGENYYRIVAYRTESDGVTLAESDPSASESIVAAVPAIAVDDDSGKENPAGSYEGYYTPVNHQLTISKANGVLTNDFDPNGGDNLTAALDADVEHGSLTLNLDGSFTYTPQQGFTGTDSFGYHNNNGVADSETAYVTIRVSNRSVILNDDAFSVANGGVLNVLFSQLAANDDNPDNADITYLLSDSAEHGTIARTASGFTYRANPGFTGIDYLTYQVKDNGGVQSNIAVIALQVAGAPTPPPYQPVSTGDTLAGLWNSYISAKDRLGDVAEKLAEYGVATRSIKDIDPTTHAATAAIDFALLKYDQVNLAYDRYVTQFAATFKAAAPYMESTFHTSNSTYEVLSAILKLPSTVAGIQTSRTQAQTLSNDSSVFAAGAAVMVINNTMVLQTAQTTHDLAEKAIQIGGLASLAVSGVELLTEEGCAAFAKAAASQAVNLAAGVAVNTVASRSIDYLADQFGISKDDMQIGADLLQLCFLVKAARAERAKAGANCFVAGTEVVTARNSDGTFSDEPIQDIKVGDQVWSKNQYDLTAPDERQTVTQVFQHTAYSLSVVTIQDSAGLSETIQSTTEHPYYVLGQGWTGAQDLTPGEKLIQDNGSYATVVSDTPEAHPEGISVYNFTVDQDHTYFVDTGGDAVWVHNTCSRAKKSLDPSDDGSSLRDTMIRKYGGQMLGMEAHHAIPLELRTDPRIAPILQLAADAGWDMNGIENGIIAPEGHGPHQGYTMAMKADILRLLPRFGSTPQDARGILDLVVRTAKADKGFWFDF